MNRVEDIFIICPHCGAQYLPSEIYIPKYFVGTTSNILKNNRGEIEYWEGEVMNTAEEYNCDFCKNSFSVDAVIKFTSSSSETTNFNCDHISTIYDNRIVLDEDVNKGIKNSLFERD